MFSVMKKAERTEPEHMSPRTRVRLEGMRRQLAAASTAHAVRGLAKSVRTAEDAAETLQCPVETFTHRRAHTALTKAMGAVARARHRRQSTSDLMWRLKQAGEDYATWHWVFDTLTVAEPAILENNKAWSRYARSMKKMAGECHHFAVVEHGETSGRIHLHVLWIIKHLPDAWRRDPMRNEMDHRREIEGMKALWPHGWSTPIAVRFSRGDAYGKLGWKWPRDGQTKEPIPEGKPAGVAGYLVKYLRKDDSRTWRPRISRALGLLRIQRMVEHNPIVATALAGQKSPLHLMLWQHGNRPTKKLLKQSALAFALRGALNGRMSTAVRTRTTRIATRNYYALPKTAIWNRTTSSRLSTGTSRSAEDCSRLTRIMKHVRGLLDDAVAARARDNPRLKTLEAWA